MPKRDKKKEFARAIPQLLGQLSMATAQSQEQAMAAQSLIDTMQDMMAADYQEALEEQEKKQRRVGTAESIGSIIGSVLPVPGGPLVGSTIGRTIGAQVGGADESALQSLGRTGLDELKGSVISGGIQGVTRGVKGLMGTSKQLSPKGVSPEVVSPEGASPRGVFSAEEIEGLKESSALKSGAAAMDQVAEGAQGGFRGALQGFTDRLDTQAIARELGGELVQGQGPPVRQARAHPMLDTGRASTLRGEMESRREAERTAQERAQMMGLQERQVATQEERTALQATEAEHARGMADRRLEIAEGAESRASEKHELEMKLSPKQQEILDLKLQETKHNLDQMTDPQLMDMDRRLTEANIANIEAQTESYLARAKAYESGVAGSGVGTETPKLDMREHSAAISFLNKLESSFGEELQYDPITRDIVLWEELTRLYEEGVVPEDLYMQVYMPMFQGRFKNNMSSIDDFLGIEGRVEIDESKWEEKEGDEPTKLLWWEDQRKAPQDGTAKPPVTDRHGVERFQGSTTPRN